MSWLRILPGVALTFVAASLLYPHAGRAASEQDKNKVPAVRWDETRPGCTFSRSDDGKYRYGLWSGDVAVTMAIDSQELEKVHHRHEPFFAVLLSVRYRGQGSVDVSANNISLEFLKHFRVIQTSLDPDDFAAKVQQDSDALNEQIAHEIEKHPDQKEHKEAYMRAFLKDSAELTEFVGKNSLRAATLNTGNPEASGWVLFSTQSKWISGWKKQEEFILRIPLEGKIFEFPFKLPPKPGEAILRKRE